MGGVAIGTVQVNNAGQGGNSLRIDFNANATPAAITTLIRNLKYTAPTGGDRGFTLTLNDGDGSANGGDPDTSANLTVSLNTAPFLGLPTSLAFADKVDYATGSFPWSVATADVNVDGKADLLVANNMSNTVSVLLNQGGGTFASKVDYETGVWPVSITRADVNGDGRVDLMVANGGSSSVSVLLNNGDGTSASKVDYATGSSYTVASTDANGDGKADLLVASGDHAVSVLLNQGDGTFGNRRDYGTGGAPYSIASADANGDGKADLFVANAWSHTVSVLLNRGDGTFTDKVDYATGSSPYSVSAADVSGDGKVDLLVTNAGSHSVSVLLNNGDGTFAGKVDYSTGNFPRSIALADFNSDGKVDMVVTKDNAMMMDDANFVAVLLSNGDGTFASKADFTTGPSPHSVAAADVNGDGKVDVLVANMHGNTLSVLLNTGTLTPTAFTEQTPHAFAANLSLNDADGNADWNGGRLSVQITANNETADSLSLPGSNPGGSAIWLDSNGNKLMAGTTQIGTADAASVSNGTAWTFTFNANASNALVQAAGRALIFNNSSDNPGTGTRTVTLTATDNHGASRSISQTITVTLANDAPVLDPSASPAFATLAEGATNPAGIRVANLITDGSIGDPDGTAVEAIAITGLNTRLGTWQYSLDGGTSWLSINADLVNSSTNELALLLGPTAQLRLLPFGNLNGSLNDAITFRAWDQTNGTPGTYTVITSTGGNMAFSANSDTASITVTAVNDAPSFDLGSGKAIVPVASGIDYGRSLTVQPDGKILVAGCTGLGVGLIRLQADGGLDAGFGSGGKAIIPTISYLEQGYGVTLQADGKILVTGLSNLGLSLIRLQADGSLDASFGVSGTATVPAGSSYDYGRSLTVQADGKILVAGFTYTGGNYDFSLIRFNADGSLDTTFNGTGKAIVPVGSGDDRGQSVTVQADGKILVAGYSNNGGNVDFSLIRLNTDGSLDTTFNGTGKIMVPVGSGSDDSHSVTVQADGKILVAGTSYNGSDNDFSLIRLNADGSLDTTFNGTGKAMVPVGSSQDWGYSITVQADGKILVAGSSRNGSDEDFSLIRLNANGSLDATFNDSGRAVVPVGSSNDIGRSVTVQADGKVLVAGSSEDGSVFFGMEADFSLIRLNADGSLDTAFNTISSLNGAPTYVENATPVALDSTVALYDADLAMLNNGAGNYAGASLTLSRHGGANSQDLFSFNTTGALFTLSGANLQAGGLTFATVSNSGGSLVISFTSSGTIATQALVNDVASRIHFANGSDAPPASAQIDWTFSDNITLVTGSSMVTITAVNDAPVLNTVRSPSLNAIFQTDTAGPSGSIGTLVSELVSLSGGSANVSDLDGGALIGLAVTTTDNSHGTWYYSINGGSTWNTVGVVVDNSALLLAPTDRLYFQADGIFSGTLASAIRFRTWDQTSGSHGNKVDTTSNGGSTAFSTATDSAALIVIANVVPTLSLPTNLSFATEVNWSAGRWPTSVASADVNGDGRSDLVVANAGSNTVAVLLNNGDSTFSSRVDYGTGASAASVASTDVNGDSYADLLVANAGGNTISVLLNNGDGTFAAKVDYVTGAHPTSVASTDIDGDGRADLLVANEGSNTVAVLLNNGDGTFAAKVDYVTGSLPASIVSADVNGDGRADLLVANAGSDTVSVLLNNGDGTFTAKVDYVTGDHPASIASTDVNGDGHADLLVTNEGSSTVSVLLNNGDGTFASKVDYATGSGPNSAVSTDVNGDGKADLLVTNAVGNTVSVLLNQGNGTFAAKTDYAIGTNPVSIANGDFNGDGKADLVTANFGSNTVSVLLNTGTQAPVTFTEQTPLAFAANLTLGDADSGADWNGGSLQVRISVNPEAADSLFLPGTNPGGSGIWLSGTTLMAGTTSIGTADAISVSNGTAWTFTFNGNANNALVQSTGRALLFNNSSDNPSTGDRTVTFTATDKHGASRSASQTITITAVNDAPVLNFPLSPRIASILEGTTIQLPITEDSTLSAISPLVTTLLDSSLLEPSPLSENLPFETGTSEADGRLGQEPQGVCGYAQPRYGQGLRLQPQPQLQPQRHQCLEVGSRPLTDTEIGIKVSRELMQTIQIGQVFSFQISFEPVLGDSNTSISLSAMTGDGEPLPEWLKFDPATGTFSGTPPTDAVGEITIKVIVRDEQGKEAVKEFKLNLKKGDGQAAVRYPVMAGRASLNEQFGRYGHRWTSGQRDALMTHAARLAWLQAGRG